MRDPATTEFDAFVQMAREFPLRTGIYTFALPVFAFLQFVNGIVNDGPLMIIAALSVVAIVCSVLVTQYQIAVFRRQRLTERWLGG